MFRIAKQNKFIILDLSIYISSSLNAVDKYLIEVTITAYK